MPFTFRIATFNLEDFGEPTLIAESLDVRISALRPLLTRAAADVLCLQEVNGQGHNPARSLSALDRLIAATPYAGYGRFVSTGLHGNGPMDKHNLVVLSRFPIVDGQQIWHDLLEPAAYTPVTAVPAEGDPVQVRFDRPFLHVAIELPGGRHLHVVNLHFKAPIAVPIAGQKISPAVWRSIGGWAEGYFIGSLKRTRQALEVRLLLEKLFDREPGALVAVCGDFNAELHEVPSRLVLGDEGDTGNTSLGPRTLTALESGLLEIDRFSVLFAGRRVMLDHILVSRSLAGTCRSTTILNDDLEDEATCGTAKGRLAGSFHAPVIAEFVLAE